MAISSWALGAVNETIGAGQDRTTVSAFESAHDGETPTNGTLCTGSLVGAVNGNVYWDGWQSGQNTTTRIVLTASSGNETNGSDGSGNAAIRTGEDILFETTNPLFMDITNIEYKNTKIDFALAAISQVRIAKCFFHNISGSAINITSATADVTVKIGGCLFKDTGTSVYYQAAIFLNDSNITTTVEAFNNTVYTSSNGISEITGTIKARNCAIGNTTGNDFELVSDEDYCISDDATAVGTNSLNNQTPADLWTLPANDATGDFTVKSGSNLIANGEARAESWFTELVPTDLAGTSWAGTPSIGCFEVITGGGAVTWGMLLSQSRNRIVI